MRADCVPGWAVEPERVAERAYALLRGPEIRRERRKRGGVIGREGLVALVDVTGRLCDALVDAGDLGLRRIVRAAEEI